MPFNVPFNVGDKIVKTSGVKMFKTGLSPLKHKEIISKAALSLTPHYIVTSVTIKSPFNQYTLQQINPNGSNGLVSKTELKESEWTLVPATQFLIGGKKSRKHTIYRRASRKSRNKSRKSRNNKK